MLGVCQHAAPSMPHEPRPGVHHFRHELEDTLLPRMADEEIAVQAIRISHQSPAHLAGERCHRLDMLLRHSIDARTVQSILAAEDIRSIRRRLYGPTVDGGLNTALQERQVRKGHAPAVWGHSLMQFPCLPSSPSWKRRDIHAPGQEGLN